MQNLTLNVKLNSEVLTEALVRGTPRAFPDGAIEAELCLASRRHA